MIEHPEFTVEPWSLRETALGLEVLAEGIAADYDAKGYLAGIEVLDAVKRLGDPTAFKQVILEGVA